MVAAASALMLSPNFSDCSFHLQRLSPPLLLTHATSFAVAPLELNAEIEGEADTFSPSNLAFKVLKITDLHSQGTSNPNFEHANPASAKSWADDASERLSKKKK